MENIKDLAVFAQRLWDNFFSRRVRETQKNGLRCYRARVVRERGGGGVRRRDGREAAL
nr:MAG TPA: hypothetical protein [Caudoviricetes sp.]